MSTGYAFTPAVMERLIAIWRQVMAEGEVDETADFFRLGGDSLKATMMVEAIGAEFGVHLDEIDVFDQRKIAALAALVQVRLAGMDEGVL